MAGPHTPQVKVEAGFGFTPLDYVTTWTDLTPYHPRHARMERGRPSEFDRYSPGSLELELRDTGRDLDPTNLSGPFVDAYISAPEYPLYVGAVANETGTSLGTDNAQTLPADVAVGDLLLAYVTVDSNGSGTAISLGTGAAAWTELFDAANGTIVRHACYARIATGSDALVLTGPTEDYVCQIIRVGKHGCATTADIAVGTTATGSSAAPNPPSLAAGSTKKWLWIALAGVDMTTSTVLSGSPIGFTTIDHEQSAVSTTSVGLMWAYKHDEVGTLDPPSFTINFTRDWVTNTIAIPPATVSENRTEIVPGTPIRVVAWLPAGRTEVLNDPATGPELHSEWRATAGAITGTISGSYPLTTGTELRGRSYNWDTDASFQFGTAADGASPNHDVRIVLANGGYIGWNLTGTTLTYAVNDGGSTADDTVTWNDTNHRYLRIRFSGNDVVWESSTNASSWSTINTYTRGVTFANTVDWSYGYLYIRNSGTTTPSLDDFVVQVSRFTRFTGAVDSWDWEPLPGKAAGIVSVSADDAFATLANLELPSIWQDAVLAHTPSVWYQLSEREGDIAYDASGNARHATYPVTGIERGVDPPTPLIGHGGIRFGPKERRPGIQLPSAARITSVPFTLNVWARATERFPESAATPFSNLAGMTIYTQDELASDGWQIMLFVKARDDIDDSDANNPVIQAWVISLINLGASATIADYVSTIEDTQPHMITLDVDSTGFPTILVDGAIATVWKSYAGFSGTLEGTYIGLDIPQAGTPNGFAFPGTIDEFAVFPDDLTVAQVEALYLAATRPWDGDTTGQRIERVLDLIDWPAELRLIDRGETTMGPADLSGDALSYLQQIEATEGGRLFVGPHGEIVFHDAARVSSRDTSPTLFDTAAAGVDLLGEGFTVTQDPRFLYTAASVSRPGGDPQRYSDSTAVDRYGLRQYTATVLARTDSVAYLRAAGVVGRYSEPQPRMGAWMVAPEKRPAIWADMLDTRLGDTVRLTFTLLGSGNQFDGYLDLAEITEDLVDGAWTFVLAATPQDPGIGSFLEWDASADVGWNYGIWR